MKQLSTKIEFIHLIIIGLFLLIPIMGYGQQLRPNTTYTNSNPYYYNHDKKPTNGAYPYYYETYYIGHTNSAGKYDGWGQARTIDAMGIYEEIGEFKDGDLKSGVRLHYYQGPEDNHMCVRNNGDDEDWVYMKFSDIMKVKREIEQKGRERGYIPLSEKYQSKIRTDYLSKNSDYGFTGKNNQYISGSSSTSLSSSKIAVIVGAAVAAAYAIIKGGQAIDKTIENTRIANEREREAQREKVEREAPKSMSGVELVDAGSLGSWSFSHAKVQIRNKNNYDVIVRIGLYQGSWSDGRIVYYDREWSDSYPGVSDDNSSSIRVKANSIRTVYLRADHRGRPTNVRITSVR